MVSLDRICEQLKAQGRRVTPQRRAIIQVLLGSGTHATAEQVFARVRGVMPDMSHATVYNTLHELAELGVLWELDLGLGEHFYDVDLADHAHLICLGCGHIEDVPYDCAALELASEHTHGFEVIDHVVIFRGHCPTCISRNNQ